jgi:tetratricopeptide (TPR) repeat protein/DNA-binding SARP family transcriptional activator
MVPGDRGAAGGVRFQLLGQLVVRDGGGAVVPVNSASAQAILVALLLHPAGYADAGQLTAAVWGERESIKKDTLYHQAGNLRRTLTTLGLSTEAGRSSVRYQLVVPDTAVDARRFERLVSEAAALAGTEPEEALRRLREAVGLWRGTAALPELRRLDGVRAMGRRLDRARLDAEERLAGLEIQVGSPDLVLDRLRDLVAAHPDHTGVTAALIRTLNATGHPTEAGEVYSRAAYRYGRQIAPTIEAAYREHTSARQPSTRGWQYPDQLPPVTGYFTGRDAELARLVRERDPAGGSAISAVNGMPGVGKSALVLRAARQLTDAGRYPDGTLHVELRGVSQVPLDPSAALDLLLHGLGVPGSNIPAELEARAATYRTVIARRRVLIVLDDARDEGQVRPLLPGTASSLVLITSRRRLAGLDDADQLTLDVLAAGDAARLFRAMVEPREPGDQDTVAGVVELCGRLPLAIRIVGARLRSSRSLSTDHLLAQLRTEQGRLGFLDDGERSVKVALSMSYGHLPTEPRRAFAVLGRHPGPDLEPEAAAVMLGVPPEHAARLLDALEHASLLEQPAAGRYAFHALVRAYATTLDPGALPALANLRAHYAARASAAMDSAYPYEKAYRPPAAAGPTFATPAAARTWLDTELANLLATAHAANNAHTTHQSATLHRHLRTLGRYTAAEALHTQALTVARATADAPAELDALISLGFVHRFVGQYNRAMDSFAAALDLARRCGSPAGSLRAEIGIGQVGYATSAHDGAAASFERALELARSIGDLPGQVDSLTGLGRIHLVQGNLDAAAEGFERALSISDELGYPPGKLDSMIGLAHVAYRQGRHAAAIEGFEQTLVLAENSGHIAGTLNGLVGLGNVYRLLRAYEKAVAYYDQVLSVCRSVGDRHGELSALSGLAESQRLQGQYGPAERSFEQMLSLARALGGRNYELDAHLGLGRTYLATGDPPRALEANLNAEQLAAELGQRPDLVLALEGTGRARLALGQRSDAADAWRRSRSVLTDLGVETVEGVSVADLDRAIAIAESPEPECP